MQIGYSHGGWYTYNWDQAAAEEWERNRTLLQEYIAAFHVLDLQGLTNVDVLKRLALRARGCQRSPEPGWRISSISY